MTDQPTLGNLPSATRINEALVHAVKNCEFADKAEALTDAKIKSLGENPSVDEVLTLILPDISEAVSALLIGYADTQLSQTLLLAELRVLREEQAQRHTELLEALAGVGRRVAGPPPGVRSLYS